MSHGISLSRLVLMVSKNTLKNGENVAYKEFCFCPCRLWNPKKLRNSSGSAKVFTLSSFASLKSYPRITFSNLLCVNGRTNKYQFFHYFESIMIRKINCFADIEKHDQDKHLTTFHFLLFQVFGGSALLLCLASVDFLRRAGAAQSRRDEIAALFLNGNEIGGIADEIAKLDPAELVASAPVVGGGVPADQPLKEVPDGYMENNWGDNVHLLVKENRQTDEASNSSLKTILMWNNAYGSRRYDIGHGREPFFKYGCEETR